MCTPGADAHWLGSIICIPGARRLARRQRARRPRARGGGARSCGLRSRAGPRATCLTPFSPQSETNKNVNWLGGTGVWPAYIGMIFLFRGMLFLLGSSVLSAETQWTLTSVAHGVVRASADGRDRRGGGVTERE